MHTWIHFYIYIYIHITCIPALWNTYIYIHTYHMHSSSMKYMYIYIYTYISHAFQLYEIHVYIYIYTYISHAFQLYEIHVYIYIYTYISHAFQLYEIHVYIYIYTHTYHMHSSSMKYIYIYIYPAILRNPARRSVCFFPAADGPQDHRRPESLFSSSLSSCWRKHPLFFLVDIMWIHDDPLVSSMFGRHFWGIVSNRSKSLQIACDLWPT